MNNSYPLRNRTFTGVSSSPIEKVLHTPEVGFTPIAKECWSPLINLNIKLTERILAFCGSGNDLRTLINARSVCRVWKICAFSALVHNVSSLPIVPLGPKQLTQKFLTVIKTSSNIPLKVSIRSWTEHVVDVLHEYSDQIVFLSVNLDFDKHKVKSSSICNFQFYLPNLKHTTFHLHKVSKRTSNQIQRALQIWNNIIEGGTRVKTCNLFVPGLTNVPKLPNIKFLPPVTITHLKCNLGALNFIPANHNLPKLRNLTVGNHWNETNIEHILTQFLQSKGTELSDLRIDKVQNIQFGSMNDLETLDIRDGIYISGAQPFPELMPKLQKLKIDFHDKPEQAANFFAGLTCHKGAFEQVKEVILWNIQGSYWRFNLMPTYFPNIARFECDYTGDIESCVTTAHMCFANLVQLKCLKLTFTIRIDGFRWYASNNDILKLLTGADRVPKCKNTWEAALDGKANAICNLQRNIYNITQTQIIQSI